METVAGEKPLEVATSRMVTAADLPEGRFTVFSVPASSGRAGCDCNGLDFMPYSAGASNDSGSRKPRVFHTPKAIPAAIQMLPRILAGVLKLHHKPRQMKKPTTGGRKSASFLVAPWTK